MAVIFDLDGTLIDSLPTIAKAGNAVLAGADLSPLPVDRYRAFVGLGEQVFLDRLIAATDLDAGQRDHLMIQFMNSYKAASQDTHLFDGVPAALEAVKNWARLVYAPTNQWRLWAWCCRPWAGRTCSMW